MAPKLNAAAVSLLAVLGAGCPPAVRVTVMQPAPVNFGTARKLSVVQVEGAQSARDVVLGELVEQIQADRYFTLTDRTGEGIRVKVTHGRVQVEPGAAPAQGEIILRIDVRKWSSHRETRTVRETVHEKDPNGNPISREVDREVELHSGEVVVAASAFDPAGRASLAEREYAAKAEAEHENPALRHAAKRAVEKLVRDISPVWFTWFIRMDEEDELQRPILRIAEAGNVPYALEELRKYVNEHPDNTSARYNLAVMLDASGHYREALDLYDQAIHGYSKDYYPQIRSECAKRLAAQQALAQ